MRSAGTCTRARKARSKALRATARSRQGRRGCAHAPRPGRRRPRSGTTRPSTAAKRISSDGGAGGRQPTQVLGRDRVALALLQRLVRGQAAVPGSGERGVGAAPAVAVARRAAPAELLLLVAAL